MHSSLKVLSQHFSQVEVWALTEPLQCLDYFLFQLFCYRFTAARGIIDLSHDPISDPMSDSWPRIWRHNSLVHSEFHIQPSDCRVSRLWFVQLQT